MVKSISKLYFAKKKLKLSSNINFFFKLVRAILDQLEFLSFLID